VESGFRPPCLMPGWAHVLRDRSRDVPAHPLDRFRRRRAGEPGAPPSTPGSSALCPPTPARSLGPNPVGLAITGLAQLARWPRHRSARDRPRLAPPGLPALLALAVPREPGGAAAD